MSEIHALSGAYAVDALDDIERAQFERHLASCAACTREVATLRDTAAVLAETTVETPSAELRNRVLADIAGVRPLPPVVPPVETETETQTEVERDDTAHRPRRGLTRLLVAAAAVVAIGTGGIVWQQVSDDGPTSRTEQVLTASDAESYIAELPGGATATVTRSKKLNEAVLVTENMPAAPSGHAYVLWLQHDDVMVPAGTMPSEPDAEVLLEGDAATADGAGITVEAADVEPTTPSDDVVALITFTSV